MKALVVDDSRAIRMIIARTLQELGYEVLQAGDGRQALEILHGGEGHFDLALLDWNMPEMNGLELLQAIRADPGYRSLTVVMVTTETEIESMVAALDSGANEYIMKPFTREVLLGKLQLMGVAA